MSAAPRSVLALSLLLGGVLLPGGTALADDGAWYSADTITGASTRFAEVTATLGPAYDAASKELRVLGRGAEELEVAVGLAGERLPAEARERATVVRKRITAAHLSTQRHVDLLGEDYDRVFREAVERAIAAQDGSVEECVPAPRRGGPAMPGFGAPKASCPGQDLSLPLAQAIDSDQVLAAELASIAAVPWPQVEVPTAEQPVLPLTGSQRYLSLAPVARALVGDELDRVVDDLDRTLARIAPEGDLTSDPETLAEAKEARAAYDAALAKLGDELFAGLGDIAERRPLKDFPALSVCTNPAVLGGCPGEDVTASVLPLLRADRKLNRDLAAP